MSSISYLRTIFAERSATNELTTYKTLNMTDIDPLLNFISKSAQDCLQRVPTIVLGSGASISHGLRGMGALSDHLRESIKTDNTSEEDAWTLIRTSLANNDGLEDALQKTSAPASLVKKIVTSTWQAIAEDDIRLLDRVARRAESLPLTSVIRHLFRSNSNTINVVTPNYDRVAEYACDLAGVMHLNGFSPGIIRRREGSDPVHIRLGRNAARTVRLWKVHGSLDWFEDNAGNALCLPLSTTFPDGLSPLIVTPGVSKYERTHDEPFRTALRGADEALNTASSFLCIGYGFRDSHIEPRLVERCRQNNIPIVILARTLTDEARSFLSNSAGTSYIALEKCDSGTKVYASSMASPDVIQNSEYWSLDKFLTISL